MKSKIFPTFLIIFFSIIFFVFYKGLQNSNIYTPHLSEKKKVPNFETKVFNTNKTMNSEEIFSEDKYYLFNIWASWCIPCRDEHYFLMLLREQKKLEIIGLNYKDTINNAKNFLDELNNPYKTIFSDLDGTIAIEWGAYGVPETFLIYDRKIIKKIIGPLNQNLTSEIISLIK
tara:strand:- start:443 stop:961 length:519 start_codon:yes stop_codon:yes gene_type:complete